MKFVVLLLALTCQPVKTFPGCAEVYPQHDCVTAYVDPRVKYPWVCRCESRFHEEERWKAYLENAYE